MNWISPYNVYRYHSLLGTVNNMSFKNNCIRQILCLCLRYSTDFQITTNGKQTTITIRVIITWDKQYIIRRMGITEMVVDTSVVTVRFIEIIIKGILVMENLSNIIRDISNLPFSASIQCRGHV